MLGLPIHEFLACNAFEFKVKAGGGVHTLVNIFCLTPKRTSCLTLMLVFVCEHWNQNWQQCHLIIAGKEQWLYVVFFPIYLSPCCSHEAALG